jgi:hypothetical protein
VNPSPGTRRLPERFPADRCGECHALWPGVCGTAPRFYYGPKILATFFQSGHNAVAAALVGVEVTAILGAVSVIATTSPSAGSTSSAGLVLTRLALHTRE